MNKKPVASKTTSMMAKNSLQFKKKETIGN